VRGEARPGERGNNASESDATVPVGHGLYLGQRSAPRGAERDGTGTGAQVSTIRTKLLKISAAARSAPAIAILPNATDLISNGPTKVKGKTVNVKPSSQTASLYRAATKQHRKLKVVLARLERLSKTALAHMAKQADHFD
jgi:hypothetical protein